MKCCAHKLPESRSERSLFHGSWNLPWILREISCGQISWKLKDENRQHLSPNFRHVFRTCRRNISPEFRSRGFFGIMKCHFDATPDAKLVFENYGCDCGWAVPEAEKAKSWRGHPCRASRWRAPMYQRL